MLLWMGSMGTAESEMTAEILLPSLLEESLYFANICHNTATRLFLLGFCAVFKINTHIFTSRHDCERPLEEIFTSLHPYTPRDDECLTSSDSGAGTHDCLSSLRRNCSQTACQRNKLILLAMACCHKQGLCSRPTLQLFAAFCWTLVSQLNSQIWQNLSPWRMEVASRMSVN